jgi:hypothetical protein
VARASQRSKLNHSTARTLAALLGTLPVALALGVLSSELLPLAGSTRYLIGYFSVFPLWVALSLTVFLAPGGKQAWLGLLAVSALLGVAFLVGRLSGGALALPGAP